MSDPPVFDATRPLVVKLPPDGARSVRLRFPTDDEIADRQRKRKAIVRNLGRGESKTEIPNSEEIDVAFLNGLRPEDAEAMEIDPAEAEYVIQQVLYCEVTDTEREPEGYRVRMAVLGANTSVVLKGPTLRDVKDFRQAYAVPMDLQHGGRRITINLHPAGELFRKLFVSSEGYSADVPLAHQAAAVLAVIDAGERLTQSIDPN